MKRRKYVEISARYFNCFCAIKRMTRSGEKFKMDSDTFDVHCSRIKGTMSRRGSDICYLGFFIYNIEEAYHSQIQN